MRKYTVFVADNFHYMDKEYVYKLGDFDTCREATEACKKIVDEFLDQYKDKKLTAESLWEQYTGFGEDPYIVSDDQECRFSAWDYAKKRSKELCPQKK